MNFLYSFINLQVTSGSLLDIERDVHIKIRLTLCLLKGKFICKSFKNRLVEKKMYFFSCHPPLFRILVRFVIVVGHETE